MAEAKGMKTSQVAGTPMGECKRDGDGDERKRTKDCKGEADDPEGEGKHCFPAGGTFCKGGLKKSDQGPGCHSSSPSIGFNHLRTIHPLGHH